MALQQYEDELLCPCGCGLPAAVTLDPENEGKFDVEPPFRCQARTALLREQKRFGEDENVRERDALMWETPKLRNGRGSG
jgi:hypothetical protein